MSYRASKRYARKYRRKSRRAPRRFRLRRRRSDAYRASNNHEVIVTKRYMTIEDVSNGNTDIKTGLNFALNASGVAVPAPDGEATVGCGTAFSPWIAQYEHYKIKKVKVEFTWDLVLQGLISDTAGLKDTNNNNRWPFLWVTDDNSSAPETKESLLERPDAKMCMTCSGVSAVIPLRPRPGQTIGGVTTSMMHSPWLDTAQPGIVHYGVKLFEAKAGKAAPVEVHAICNRIRVVTMTVAFKHIKSSTAA